VNPSPGIASNHGHGIRFHPFLEARVAGIVDVNRADSYPARLPQDWISVNVVPSGQAP